ncbi:MAG TPA: NADH-quinone oxidoreductase subunit L [Candidatus Acidoferrales bacterium]|jgi:NADH-quinone oxidoreductase subunit L|nr:NADH-quinone oxidoreductase subunit L [Candidatus Acidoferrales bacterium]
MPILSHLWIILALPLAGSAINGLLGKRWQQSTVNSVAIGAVSLTFLAVAELVREFSHLAASQIPYIGDYFTWMIAGPFRVDFALQVDQLTVVMLLVVSFVGMLIHIYSTGYMAHEGGYYRFFSYLNLFMFFMLTLVLAANLIVMFVGWEGVGLCSYLLIGFWFLKKSAADAGKKAFITTRIGDVGFTIGILFVFATFNTVDFQAIFKSVVASPVPEATLTTICILLFLGAVGKSAQLPLYVWLPDAMEGPTPISALIHAATMVTAGVYMVARMNPLFSRAPIAMLVVAIVGALTAFYAATIGLMQTDIKKVLAYSTVSQLGYMFLGCGVGAYAAGIFHLMTHAFFKGLLFLCAGSVIHAMGGEQDMMKMGGLRKQIPITYWTMLIATLAIAGIPGFAGFFSKDEILEAAQSGPHANLILWLLGVVGALLTSFYMFRLIFLTFFGAPRYDEHHVHVHESPKNMTIPLMILAFLSIFGGWFAAPHLIGGPDHFENFLHPVFAMYAPAAAESAAAVSESAASPGAALLHALVSWPVGVAILGLLVAWWFYIKSPETPKKLAQSLRPLYTLIFNKYYVDEIYAALIVRPLLWISTHFLWHVVDERVIDGTVNGVAKVARESGGEVRKLQSGNTRSYAAWVVVGAVCFTFLLLLVLGMR